jgi:hypothetical protein
MPKTFLEQNAFNWIGTTTYVVGPKSFRPDVQKPLQKENAVRDI